jgi:hypothetical protein
MGPHDPAQRWVLSSPGEGLRKARWRAPRPWSPGSGITRRGSSRTTTSTPPPSSGSCARAAPVAAPTLLRIRSACADKRADPVKTWIATEDMDSYCIAHQRVPPSFADPRSAVASPEGRGLRGHAGSRTRIGPSGAADLSWASGLYLLDEPEAALSTQNCLTCLRRIHELVLNGSQFIIATHSPIVLAIQTPRSTAATSTGSSRSPTKTPNPSASHRASSTHANASWSNCSPTEARGAR